MSRATWDPVWSPVVFSYKAVTSYGGPFQTTSLNNWIFDSMHNLTVMLTVPQPSIYNGVSLLHR